MGGVCKTVKGRASHMMHDLFVSAGFGAGTPQQDSGDKFGTMEESCPFVAGFGAKNLNSTTSWDLSLGVPFLCPNKKGTKEIVRGRGITGKSHPLPRTPTPAAPPSDQRECTDFRWSAPAKTSRFLRGKRSKIGTFLDAGWRSGWGIPKGGAFARSAPFGRIIFVLFLAGQEKDKTVSKSQFI